MLFTSKLYFILAICLLLKTQMAFAAEAHPLIVVFSILIGPLLVFGAIVFLIVHAVRGGFNKKDDK